MSNKIEKIFTIYLIGKNYYPEYVNRIYKLIRKKLKIVERNE